MLKFSANISLMFQEYENPLDRIEPAKDAGFGAVEFMFVYDLPVDEMARRVDAAELGTSIINIALGEGVTMGPLIGAAPGKEDKWRENVAAAIPYCQALKPEGLVIPAFTPPESVSKSDALATFKENLKYTGDALGEIGTKVIVEPLNPKLRVGAILTTCDETMEFLDEVGHPNIGLEYDAFHMYVTEDMPMAESVRKHLPHIGNIQIADVPDRHEPGTGEIDYQAFLGALDEMGYDKWVACEYTPSGPTLDTLAWREPWV